MSHDYTCDYCGTSWEWTDSMVTVDGLHSFGLAKLPFRHGPRHFCKGDCFTAFVRDALCASDNPEEPKTMKKPGDIDAKAQERHDEQQSSNFGSAGRPRR